MDSIDNYHHNKKFSNKRKYNYDTGFGYGGRCSNSYTPYNWYHVGPRYPKRYKKAPVRPPSPLRGTEEYRQRKIQHTSELIKRKLLTGENISDVLNYHSDREKYSHSPRDYVSHRTERRIPRTRTHSLDSNFKSDKYNSKSLQRFQKISSPESIDIEEIHNKIMKYITNLNHGRKVNLINSASSFYDNAIEQIQRQKRLELSRALRAMCSNENTESVNVINSIIPDIGINLEDLPRQVIEQLSLTLNFDYEEQTGNSLLDTSKRKTLKEENLDGSYHSLNNDRSPATTITGDFDCEEQAANHVLDNSKQKTLQQEDMAYHSPNNYTATSISDNNLEEKLQDFDSHSQNLPDYPNLTLPIMQNNVFSRKTLELQDFHDSGDKLSNNPSNDTTVIGNNFDESGNWIYQSKIKTEIEEEVDETEEGSIETVIFDDSYVQETTDFIKHHEHIDSCNVNENNFVQSNIKQEPANDKFEDVNDEYHSTNVSDDCIILPPKPIEVIDVDAESSPACVSSIVDTKPPLKLNPVDSERVNNIVSKGVNENCLQSNISKSDFSMQVNYTTLYDEKPKNLQATIQVMLQIDAEIDRLTKIRQNLFINLNDGQHHGVVETVCDGGDTHQKETNVEVKSVMNSATTSEDNIRSANNVIKEASKRDIAQSTNGNSERMLRKLTKKYMGNQPPPALKRDHINRSISDSQQIVSPHSAKTQNNVNSSSPNAAVTSDCGATSSGVTNMVTANKELLGSNGNLQFIPPNITKKETVLKTNEKIQVTQNGNPLPFNVKHKVMVAQHIGKRIFLGTENGKLFIASLQNGTISKVIHVSSQSVTCFCYLKTGGPRIYVGTLSLGVNAYDINTYRAKDFVDTQRSVQCIEREWGYLFIGCQTGKLYRYSLRTKRIEFEGTICNASIMAVKAVLEGARKVLLIASRGSPICIRDAMSTLLMRTVDSTFSPTIYSMIVLKGDIYCGTLSNDLLVYSFHDGVLKAKLKETGGKGISCMKYVSPLIFASCYDGHIYVYHTVPRGFLGKIEGPGGTILSMEVYKNKVLVGTNKPEFVDLTIPDYILNKLSQSC